MWPLIPAPSEHLTLPEGMIHCLRYWSVPNYLAVCSDWRNHLLSAVIIYLKVYIIVIILGWNFCQAIEPYTNTGVPIEYSAMILTGDIPLCFANYVPRLQQSVLLFFTYKNIISFDIKLLYFSTPKGHHPARICQCWWWIFKVHIFINGISVLEIMFIAYVLKLKLCIIEVLVRWV
jgi:hypothetical protein